jgi:ABC-2 type transport system ATP-binding protein
MEHVVTVKNLRKRYGDFELRVPELKLRSAGVTGLIGPNGAGKTTFIKCLLNLIRYAADELSILEKDNLRGDKAARAQVGFMLDDRNFFDDLTVNDLERLVSGFYAGWEKGVFQEYLTAFSIDRDKLVRRLSKGMRASLFAAVALSHNARLVILDEPTAGLDPGSKQKMLNLFETYVQNGARAIFFSTHSTTDLDKIASDIVHIERGNIKFSGAKSALLNSFVVFAENGEGAAALRERRIPFVVVKGANADRLVVRKSELSNLPESRNLEPLETNIEDIMLHAAGEYPHA